VKILPVTGKKRINFGSDLDASAMSEPPNTARAWLPGYYRGLRERYMRKVAVIFFCHSPKIAQKVGYGTPLTPKSGGYAYPRTLRKLGLWIRSYRPLWFSPLRSQCSA